MVFARLVLLSMSLFFISIISALAQSYDFQISFSSTETPPVNVGETIQNQYQSLGVTFGSELIRGSNGVVAAGQLPRITRFGTNLTLTQGDESARAPESTCKPLAIAFDPSIRRVYRVDVAVHNMRFALPPPIFPKVQTHYLQSAATTRDWPSGRPPFPPDIINVSLDHSRAAAAQDPIVGVVIENSRCLPFVEIDDIRVWSGTSPEEICGDGVDNNGDGFVDESCQCGAGAACSAGLECVTPFRDGDPTCHPPCENFCSATCAGRPDVLRVTETDDLDPPMTPDDSVTDDPSQLADYMAGDDYDGFDALASEVSGRAVDDEPMHVVFERGTYHIKKYLDEYAPCTGDKCPDPRPAELDPRSMSFRFQLTEDGRTKKLTANNFVYENAHNVHFHGCGSRIDVAPIPFKQLPDRFSGKDENGNQLYQSLAHSIIPFYFQSSSHFSVSDFEIYGNVDDAIGRTPRSVPDGSGLKPLNVENFSHGIVASSSTDYVLKNLDVHHFMVDGIQLGAGAEFRKESCTTATGVRRNDINVHLLDSNVRLDNVHSHNNGRGALTVNLVDGLTVTNSRFESSGKTGNPAYQGWPGLHGLDVEPDLDPFPGDCSGNRYADGKTRNLQFLGTKFTDNLGRQVAAARQTATEGILLKGPGCEIAAGRANDASTASPYAIWFGVPGVEIDNCDIILRSKIFVAQDSCGVAPRASLYMHNSRFTYEHDGITRSIGRILNLDHPPASACIGPASIRIENNTFTFGGARKTGDSPLPPIRISRGDGTEFVGNRVMTTAKVHRANRPFVEFPTGIALARDNTYLVTDPSNLPSGTGVTTNYGFTPAINDRYPSHPHYRANGTGSYELCPDAPPDAPATYCYNSTP